MTETTAPTTEPSPVVRIGLAVLLLLPALLCCGFQYALPSVSTLMLSLQKTSGIGGDAQFVGAENYTQLFKGGPFAASVGFTLAIIVVRVLAVSLLPLLIGQGLAAVGPRPRRIIRVLLAACLALFVPVAIAITWRLLTSPRGGLIDAPVFASPNSARLALLAIDGLYVLSLASAAGAWLYPLASNGGRGAKIVIFSVLIFAAITSGLQTSVLSAVATSGGPSNSTSTLVIFMTQAVFVRLQLGAGAAVGVLILIPVMLLGFIAAILIVATDIRLAPVTAAPADEPGQNRGVPPMALLAISLVPVLACCLVSALPLLWIAFQSLAGNAQAGFERVNLGAALTNTIGPAFISAFLIELPIALVGAFAIGGLRPLGKRSEYLLLLFSPWLFVTVAPLIAPLLLGLIDAKRLGEFTTLFTPLALSVPLLFVLTLFFKGQATQPNPAGWLQLLVRSLPLALGAAAVLFFVHLNEFLWPYAVSRSPDSFPFPVLLSLVSQQLADLGSLAPLLTFFWLPMAIVFFIVFGAWLAFYGDRLVLERTAP